MKASYGGFPRRARQQKCLRGERKLSTSDERAAEIKETQGKEILTLSLLC